MFGTRRSAFQVQMITSLLFVFQNDPGFRSTAFDKFGHACGCGYEALPGSFPTSEELPGPL